MVYLSSSKLFAGKTTSFIKIFITRFALSFLNHSLNVLMFSFMIEVSWLIVTLFRFFNNNFKCLSVCLICFYAKLPDNTYLNTTSRNISKLLMSSVFAQITYHPLFSGSATAVRISTHITVPLLIRRIAVTHLLLSFGGFLLGFANFLWCCFSFFFNYYYYYFPFLLIAFPALPFRCVGEYRCVELL